MFGVIRQSYSGAVSAVTDYLHGGQDRDRNMRALLVSGEMLAVARGSLARGASALGLDGKSLIVFLREDVDTFLEGGPCLEDVPPVTGQMAGDASTTSFSVSIGQPFVRGSPEYSNVTPFRTVKKARVTENEPTRAGTGVNVLSVDGSRYWRTKARFLVREKGVRNISGEHDAPVTVASGRLVGAGPKGRYAGRHRRSRIQRSTGGVVKKVCMQFRKSSIVFLNKKDSLAMQTMRDQIVMRIERLGAGKAFSAKDFLDIASRGTIDMALSGLNRDGVIRRIRRGLYDMPKFNPALGGKLSPDIDEAARALARRQRWKIVPEGAWAANLLGLSTQVPSKIILPDRWSEQRGADRTAHDPFQACPPKGDGRA